MKEASKPRLYRWVLQERAGIERRILDLPDEAWDVFDVVLGWYYV